MLKMVKFYTDPKDDGCTKINEYLSDLEIQLQVYDITKDPLNKKQVGELLQHFNIDHFLNRESKAFKKNKLDKDLPEREQVLEMIAEDNDLLRRPIIVAGRLMTVGCNVDKIKEMLQVGNNGHEPETNDSKFNKRRRNNDRDERRK